MVILLFKMAHRRSHEVFLSTKKAVMMCPTEKILGNFRLGTSYSAVAHMFKVNESRLHIK